MAELTADITVNTLYHQDCIELMRKIPDETIDLIIADPPYFRVKGEFDFVWKDQKEYINWLLSCIREFRRILKNDGTFMLWGGLGKKNLTLCRAASAVDDEGLFILQNWITQRNTRGIGTKRNYMSAREELLFYTKSEDYVFHIPYTEERSLRKDLGANGKPRKNSFKRVSNVWNDIAEASQSSKERCIHPTVKAQKLCDRIILTHSDDDDLVYIPFAGSGSEIVSCVRHHRQFIASETNGEYIALMEQRVPTLLADSSFTLSVR